MVTARKLGFPPVDLSEHERDLVRSVRSFARARKFPPSSASPTRGGFSREFSAELAEQGWVGMTIPLQYGGTERTTVERILVVSELLAAGAPLGAHWTADRQTAPSLLINGPESLRQLLLPQIAAGRCLIAGGFSEPDSGSDLASVRTRARRVEGGWRITGRKIWTTDADQADYIEVLCRTSDGERKHEGLSLIVVPMDTPGLEVHPIEGMDGERHFNEVILEEVFARDDWLIGSPGAGWEQLTAELALERAGPERYLTTMPLFEAFVDSRALAPNPGQDWELIGRVVSQQIGLREMTLSIARLVDDGGSPVAEAAMAKDLGTELEQLLVDELWPYRAEPLAPGPEGTRFHEFLDINRLRSPVFTTAGGTNEVLRLLVGRQLREWSDGRRSWALSSDVAATVATVAEDLLEQGTGSVPRDAVDAHSVGFAGRLAGEGFLGVGIPDELGGGGGTLDDILDVIAAAAYSGVSLPAIEGPLTAGWLAAQAGIDLDWLTEPAVFGGVLDSADPAGNSELSGLPLNGPGEIPWAHEGTPVVFVSGADSGPVTVTVVPAGALAGTAGATIAGEPVLRQAHLAEMAASRVGRIETPAAEVMRELQLRAALGRSVALAAAIQRTAELGISYAYQREQFGQPIARFQAVQTHLVRVACEAQRVAVAVDAARKRASTGILDAATTIAAARVLTGDAAISAARTIHQVHGAIGVTMEYPLQRLSRRLWAWSLEDGGTASWARELGQEACARGVWGLITGAD
ncbi:acyl-CoA dehydrogenase family protein [Arthrobacter sp. 18067]|uniref:acyl-CoA dehydrogenase family protein n=1 Tax=Arthrobacter sp. 18067 TaxID=2681413 RepID=UPI00135BE2B6|nr:acyl-CoA dehydrogenase family protein [Arthrobacter sp. 18067]